MIIGIIIRYWELKKYKQEKSKSSNKITKEK